MLALIASIALPVFTVDSQLAVLSIHIAFHNTLFFALFILSDSCLFITSFVIDFMPSILMPPVNGIGAYFGRLPIFLPSASNGSNAALATLLTHFAAMNAIQMKISAIISTIIVPTIPADISSAPLSVAHLFVPVTAHSNVYFKLPRVTTVSVVLLASSIFVCIVLFVFQKRVMVQSVGLVQNLFPSFCLCMSIDTTTRPNESASPTIAGTNASPINSFRSKDSLSLPKILSQRTNFSVMRGENIA